MNSAPMILRFFSGSVTPASRARKRDAASTTTSGSCIRLRNRSSTWAASCSRSRPLSTKMQVSRSPIALCTSSAATVESTPPDRPQTTRPSPTSALDAGHGFVDERRHRPVAAAAADVEGEVPQQVGAVLRVHDFGVEQQAVEPAIAVLDGDDRRRRAAWRRPRSPAARRRPSRRGWPRPSASAPGRRTAVRSRRPSHRHGRTRGATTASACRPGPAS